MRDWQKEILEAQLLGSDLQGPCFKCGHEGDLIHCGSRRMDCDTGYDLCAPCAAEYHSEWDEVWNDYYSSRL